ncbi:hypothetical protein N2152v2_003194 [Parachlorella kessleri]
MASSSLSLITRQKLLDEMLGTVRDETGGQWAVLVLDAMTTKVMSSVAGISDIMDFSISLVDDIAKRREPLPALVGIYFLTPSDANIKQLVRDFSISSMPQYKSAYVFFSGRPSRQQLEAIKECQHLVSRLRCLKEVNLEYLVVDRRTFNTNEEESLRTFFGASVDSSSSYRVEIDTLASRLASAFITLKEFPAIRFRAAAPPGEEFPPGLESRLLVAQRIAVELHERLLAVQRAGQLPERETCELILTDRGFDPVAPVIHEWTYEAMVFDMLGESPSMRENVFLFDSETKGGKTEQKEHLLDERDPLYVELRHQHFAAASLKISGMMDEFTQQNRVASRSKTVGEMDLKGMSKLIQQLPQYRDQLSRLGAHVEIASRLNGLIEVNKLTELGKLEQDLVYGDATSKEVINFLSLNQTLPAADKVRLLMCYSATHLEKLDATRQQQWQKVARLNGEDMACMTNLEYLGVPVRKRNKGGGITFGRKRRRAVRKDRDGDEDDQQFALSRFVPMLQEVLEDAAAGKLSNDEYPYVRTPSSPSGGSIPSSADTTPKAGGLSARTVRTTGVWAKKATGTPTKEDQSKGKRIFAFIIGGVTFSEMRVAHRLSSRLGREIVLGGTSVETPSKFLKHVLELGTADHAALEIDSGNRFKF